MVQRNKSNQLKAPGSSRDFFSNRNPFLISKSLFKKININSKNLADYPSPHADKIISSLEKFLNLKKENIIFSNGSSELFFLIPEVFKFKTATILAPSFWEYEHTLKIRNVKMRFFYLREKNNFEFNLSEFEKAINHSEAVYLCNPNNPTSSYIDGETIIKLIKKFPKKIFILDETYLLFDKDYEKKSLNGLATKTNNLLVVSSLSKIFSIGGMRAGFGVSSRKNIEEIRRLKNPYSHNIFTEILIPLILEDSSYLKKSRSFIEKEKIRIFNSISKNKNFLVFKPYANFFLIKIKDKDFDFKGFRRLLGKNNIRLRWGHEFRSLSDYYFRFNIRTSKDNDLLLKVLNSLKDKHKQV